MASTSVTEIVCAHSPDSDDAYMFYGLATKKVRSRLVNFRHVLEDIETSNRKALEGAYELTAISYHAYPYVADKYVLMASGSSIGDGYGPILASVKPMAPEEIKGKKIAIPGRMTSAYLDAEAVRARLRRSGDSVRQDPGRGGRTHRGRGADHSRGPVDLRQKRLSQCHGSGPLVEIGRTICRCRWAETCCCGRCPTMSKASAAA